MHAKRTPWPVDSKGRPVRRVRVKPGIYRSVSGKLEVQYTDSDGRVRFEPQESPNVGAAERRRRAIVSKKEGGAVVRPSPTLKFGEVRQQWLDVEVSAKTAESTRVSLRYHAGKLPWQDQRMDRIDSGDVARALRDLRAAGHAASTVAKVRSAADAIFKFARREMRWAQPNPVTDLPRSPRASTGPHRLHSRDELTATLRAAQPWAKAPLAFIAETALRESEALAVQWHELHLDDETPYVEVAFQLSRASKARPADRVALKTDGSASVVPLTGEVVRLLREHKLRSRHGAPDDYVFCTGRGTPISQRNLLRELDRAQRHAVDEGGQPVFPAVAYLDADGKLVLRRREDGQLVRRRDAALPDVHALRHTLATNLVDRGASIEDVSKILRHKDSTTTARVYVHEIRSAEALRRRAGLLEAMESGMASAARHTPAPPVEAEQAEVAFLSRNRASAG